MTHPNRISAAVIAGIIERLEKATGPDVALDHEIARALGDRFASTHKPGVTSSIDLALTLLSDEDYLQMLAHMGPHCWVAEIANRFDDRKKDVGESETAPLALCIAILRAREVTP